MEGCSNDSLVVNLLFTAPGKWTLNILGQQGDKIGQSRLSYWSEPGFCETELHVARRGRLLEVVKRRIGWPLVKRMFALLGQRWDMMLSIDHTLDGESDEK